MTGGWQYHPALFVFNLGIVLSVAIVAYCLQYGTRRRLTPTVGLIGLAGAFATVYLLGAGLQLASTDLSLTLLFHQLKHVGGAPLPSVAIALVLLYLHPDRLTRGVQTVLVAVPAAMVLLVVLGPPGLLFPDPALVEVGGHRVLTHGFTPLTVMYFSWPVVGTLFASVVVARSGLTRPRSRVPATVVSLALLLPAAVLSARLLHLVPAGGSGVDLTPAAGAVALGVLVGSVAHLQLGRSLQTARRAVLDHQPTGYLLVDRRGRVVDANRAAASLLATDGDRLRNTSLEKILPSDAVDAVEASQRQAVSTYELDDSPVQVQAVELDVPPGVPDRAVCLTETTSVDSRDETEVEMPVGLFRLAADDSEHIRAGNERLIEQFGAASLASLRQRPLEELFADADGQKTVFDAIRTTGSFDGVIPLRTVDGEVWHARLAAVRADDQETFARGALLDVTRRVEREQRVQRLERLGELVLDPRAPEALAEDVCRVLVDSYRCAGAWVWTDLSTDVSMASTAPAGSHHRPEVDPPWTLIDRSAAAAVHAAEPASVAVTDVDQLPQTATLPSDATVRSVPLTFQGAVFGILSYVDTPATPETLTEVVSTLSKTVAHETYLKRQRRVLAADEVLVVTLQIRGRQHPLTTVLKEADVPAETALSVTHVRPNDTDAEAAYLLQVDSMTGATGDAEEVLNAVETAVGGHPDLAVQQPPGGSAPRDRLRVMTRVTTAGEVLTRYGGLVSTATADSSTLTLEVQFQRQTGIHQAVDDLSQHYTVTLLSKTVETREYDYPAPADGLSDKQLEALRVATRMGFFERPQQATGEEVAAVLGVSRSTFLRHVRAAEQTVLDALFVHSARMNAE